MVRYGVLAALLAAPAVAQQQPVPTLSASETLLQVEAVGTARATPDLAVISAAVTTDAANARAALAANTAAMVRVIGAVRGAGVPESAMRTADLRVSPRFRQDKDGDDTEEVIGSRAVNRLKVRLTHVADAGRVVEALTQAGATEVSGPDFGFQDDAGLRRQARAAAVRRAQEQAVDYATPFGLRPGRILRISERSATSGDGQDIVVTANRAPVPAPPVLPGEQELTVTVWVDYALSR